MRLEALDAPDLPDVRAQRDPWLRALAVQSWLTLDWPAKALSTLGPVPAEGEPDARLAWLRVRAQRALARSPEAVLAAELDWFRVSGLSSLAKPELAPLEAALAVRSGQREQGVRILEAALEQRPGDPDLLLALARLENTEGRRTRAIELLDLAVAGRAGAASVLALLDVLRTARDEGEISEQRWWAEVEALEAERPEDPAPARELAARAFERAKPGEASGRAQALERLARLRARTLARPLETLRSGEGERWIQLLARYTPERAVSFAEEELRRDPSDPGLWRASATALLAAGRPRAALERLEALQKVAPDPATTSLVALTSFQIENDPVRFAERLAAMKLFDKNIEDDAVLAFYLALVGPRGKGRAEDIQRALELWAARAENGLATPEHGRMLALELFYDGRRAPALAVLGETRQLARSALERDMLEALGQLMRSAPATPRRLKDAPAPPTPAADDAPDKGPKAGKPKKPAGQRAAAGNGAAKSKAAKSKAGGQPSATKAKAKANKPK